MSLTWFKTLRGLSDEELMNRAQGGNDRTLEEIYRRYSQPLLRYFFRMLWQDTAKAEDFLHDLFIKIVEKPTRFDTQRKFSTWVFSVAHNMCKNEYRKQALRAAHAKTNGHHVIDPGGGDALDRQSFQEKLETLLRDEPEEIRTMFLLRHELDLTFPEISEILSLPEGTVKSRLFYFTRKLSTTLEHFKVILEK